MEEKKCVALLHRGLPLLFSPQELLPRRGQTDDAPPFSAQQIPRRTPKNLITQLLTGSVLHHAKTRADQPASPASLHLSQVTFEVTASGTE